MSWIVLDIELTEKIIINELGLFVDGSVQGFSFCPPKNFKTIKQTTWNTSHLHGIELRVVVESWNMLSSWLSLRQKSNECRRVC